jgi:Tol biopolymer transport system component
METMMRKSLIILIAAALFGIVAGCSSGGDPAEKGSVERAEDVFAKARGWIAFRSEGVIEGEIVAVDPANPKDTLVLAPASREFPIAWSSDGTKLLLRSGQDCCPYPGLFVLHADDSRTTLRPVTDPAFPTWDPPTWGSFSPDGTEVVYGADGRSRGPYIIDAEGGKPRPLGRCQNPVQIPGKLRALCGEPLPEAAAWSPDGSRIAWFDFIEDSAQYGHHASVLSFVNPDGTGLREEVAPLPGVGYSLVWSPDGSRLAFWQTEDWDPSRPGEIFVINADGSSLQQITRDGNNRWPTWSPDGSRIAFVHDGTLSTMAPDGTDMESVQGVTTDGPIAWNPAE